MRPQRTNFALIACIGLTAASANAASYTTTNFIVHARRADVARQVAIRAEECRREKALQWLGYELDNWPEPCEVNVKVTLGGAGGATSFAFDQGQVLSQRMTLEGPLDRILNSVVPHEVTHTIFAARFRRPLPRWADEGGAVLSEDFQELARHDLLVRSLINGGRMIPLTRLFVLTEYPRDVMALYAQGFSVANYLVSLRGRQQFLDFVWDGQQYGWETAANRHYGFRSVNELENRWIAWLIEGKGTGADPSPILAEQSRPQANPAVATRTAPPSENQPIFRGQKPDDAPTPLGVAQGAISPAAGNLPSAQPIVGPTGPVIATSRPVEQPPARLPEDLGTQTAGLPTQDQNLARHPAFAGQTTTPAATAGYSTPSTSTSAASPIRPTRRIPIAVGRTRRSAPAP